MWNNFNLFTRKRDDLSVQNEHGFHDLLSKNFF